MLPSSLWTAENVTIIKSYSSAFFFSPFFPQWTEPKNLMVVLSDTFPSLLGVILPRTKLLWSYMDTHRYFFLSWISGGPWDKSSHEVVEVYPVCALCQPPWGWASCDLPLWLLKASYGRKNVLPHTWWEGNIGFAGWAYQYGFHVWNCGIFFF